MRKWYLDDADFRRLVDTAGRARLLKASEQPTIERQRQDGGVSEEAADYGFNGQVIQTRSRAKITCKLDWYLMTGTITDLMWQAGMRFAFLHFVSGKLPRTTPMYGQFIQGRRGYDPHLEKSASQKKLERALNVLLPAEADVIWDVCGNDVNAGTPGRIRDLRTGLRALTVHFDLKVLG